APEAWAVALRARAASSRTARATPFGATHAPQRFTSDPGSRHADAAPRRVTRGLAMLATRHELGGGLGRGRRRARLSARLRRRALSSRPRSASTAGARRPLQEAAHRRVLRELQRARHGGVGLVCATGAPRQV